MVAKVECHPGELVPRVGFIVTNLSRPTRGAASVTGRLGPSRDRQITGQRLRLDQRPITLAILVYWFAS